jgi:hypothetical protein
MFDDGRGRGWLAFSLLADPAAAKPAREKMKSRRGFEVFIAATPFEVRGFFQHQAKGCVP